MTSLYFLEYDLRKSRDYQRLYDALKNVGAVRMLESSWCFRYANTNCVQLRDFFKQFVDGDDAIVVSQVTDWATWNALGNPNSLKSVA